MEGEEKYLPATVVLLIVSGAILILYSIIAEQMLAGTALLSDKGILISRAVLFPLGVLMMFWGIFISLSRSDKIAKSITGALAIVMVFSFEIYLIYSPPRVISDNLLKFRVAAVDRVVDNDTTKVVIRVVLDSNTPPPRSLLKSTAESIWRSDDTTADNFSVLFYLPDMDVQNVEYAYVEFCPGGMKSMSVHNYILKNRGVKSNYP
ncbi:hypothetical protein DRQ26_03665 [bacterium]|nr:MAG: hypothetical protein DRQ26_03665 [bacterium]